MIVCTMTALIDLLPLVYGSCSAAITSHHITVTEIDQLS
jgi:hypothetical protein